MADKYGHTKVKCNCKDCGIEMNRRIDSFSSWSGRCVGCYHESRKTNAKLTRHGYTDVTCKDCNKKWAKRNDGLKKWKGFCVACSHKYKNSTDEQRERCRINMEYVRLKFNGSMPMPVYKRGEEHANWKGGLPKCADCGIGVSLYTVKRCANCHHKFKKGENHHNWKGGISGENVRIRQSKEYSEWRRDVFKRDNWSCTMCGHRSKKRGDIKADHIKPFYLFPDLRLDVENGRTLCLNCDHVYGYNHNRDKAKIINISGKIDKNISWKYVEKIV